MFVTGSDPSASDVDLLLGVAVDSLARSPKHLSPESLGQAESVAGSNRLVITRLHSGARPCNGEHSTGETALDIPSDRKVYVQGTSTLANKSAIRTTRGARK